ncbi:hypothetical protein TNIN_335361 [Trichonephila inaurata madagascariensis]|uniref:Uncharacterized protein n=1 Tax=Trichonephila inaurata madagascariensis TaxID=2747483 RepID=A0A8X6XPB9_9ARAC|nr:hypothetical protein TNIN_335361 [Trichonephila inaurata madagascariensis]
MDKAFNPMGDLSSKRGMEEIIIEWCIYKSPREPFIPESRGPTSLVPFALSHTAMVVRKQFAFASPYADDAFITGRHRSSPFRSRGGEKMSPSLA